MSKNSSQLFSPDGDGLNVLICSSYNHYSNWMAFANWYSVYKYLPKAKVAIAVGRSSRIDHYYYHWVYKCDNLNFHLHKNVGDKLGFPYLNKLYGVYVALKDGVIKPPFIVLDADMMAVNDFSTSLIDSLSKSDFATNVCPYQIPFTGGRVGPIWYFNQSALEKVTEAINTLKTLKGRDHLDLLALSKVYGNNVVVLDELGNEIDEGGTTTFTHYSKGCGNYTKKEWEKGKTLPPFNVAYALHSLDSTVNENKVLGLWSQMGNIWDLTNQVKM